MKNNIIVGRNLLEIITSALYESPIILFREYVQNSLDAYNIAIKDDGKDKIVAFKVDITVDKEKEEIVIVDNGYGVYGSTDFEKEMLRFGDSTKKDRSLYIGFHGIGRIAALPFCKKLIFENKAENATNIDICEWDGSGYRKLLNDEAADVDSFQETVQKIVKISKIPCDKNEMHYFKVKIINYSQEIKELLEQINFDDFLTRLLPVKYSEEFEASQKIIQKYKEFMNEDISDFMCSVFFNEKELRKSYTDDTNVLDSGIIFREIREKSNENQKPGDKIGLLWFTFNKKMTASKDSNYGIMVRSKNVLMGNNDTFASLCANSKEYVGTFSELTATLRGVYGELLINSPNLTDNARRDWFKTDEYSMYLKYIIVDFMKRLYTYRYAASKFFRSKNQDTGDSKRIKLKEALIELVDVDVNEINISEFSKKDVQDSKKDGSKESAAKYSDEDIPRESQTKRRNYDELMLIVEEFFVKEKLLDVFLKLRAYIKNHFNTDEV